MPIMSKDIFAKIRELFPEVPEGAKSVVITIDVHSPVVIDCKFFPKKEAQTNGSEYS